MVNTKKKNNSTFIANKSERLSSDPVDQEITEIDSFPRGTPGGQKELCDRGSVSVFYPSQNCIQRHTRSGGHGGAGRDEALARLRSFLASRLGFGDARAELDGPLGLRRRQRQAEPVGQRPQYQLVAHAGRQPQVGLQPDGRVGQQRHHRFVQVGQTRRPAVVADDTVVAAQVALPQPRHFHFHFGHQRRPAAVGEALPVARVTAQLLVGSGAHQHHL